MNIFIKVFLVLIFCSIFSACSEENNNSIDSKQDHVWKEQTDTIDKAKEAEAMILDAAANTQRAIENQSE